MGNREFIWSGLSYLPSYCIGTVLFLIYINDISKQVSPPLCLFADNCLLYRVIYNKPDAQQLQLDFDCLSQWGEIWQMSFNVSKCVVMKCSKSTSIISLNYSLNGHLLDTKTEHICLGLTLQNKMSWASHINSIVNKTSRTLNFLKCNTYSSVTTIIESLNWNTLRECRKTARLSYCLQL